MSRYPSSPPSPGSVIRAWSVSVDDLDGGVTWGETRSKARYASWLQVDNVEIQLPRLRLLRLPEEDLVAPSVLPEWQDLGHDLLGIVAHAYGAESDLPGHRRWFTTNPDDLPMLALVELGLFEPVVSKVPLGGLRLWRLTDVGEALAVSLCWRRRSDGRLRRPPRL